jgi:hypothetical protein
MGFLALRAALGNLLPPYAGNVAVQQFSGNLKTSGVEKSFLVMIKKERGRVLLWRRYCCLRD